MSSCPWGLVGCAPAPPAPATLTLDKLGSKDGARSLLLRENCHRPGRAELPGAEALLSSGPQSPVPSPTQVPPPPRGQPGQVPLPPCLVHLPAHPSSGGRWGGGIYPPCWCRAPSAPLHVLSCDREPQDRSPPLLPSLTRPLLWGLFGPLSLWPTLQRESKTDAGPSKATGRATLSLRQGASRSEREARSARSHLSV